MSEQDLIPDPSKPESVVIAGSDLAGTIADLEGKGRMAEAVDLVGQSRYRLHHRPERKKWRALRGVHCEAGRIIDF